MLGGVVVALTAVCHALILNLTMLAGADEIWAEAMLHRNAALYADCLVLFVLWSLLWAVTGRLSLTIGISTPIVVLVAVVNSVKLDYRLEPLYPSDRDFVSEPSFLFTMVPLSQVVLGVLALLVIGFVLTRLIGWFARPWRFRWAQMSKGDRLVRLGVRAVTATLAGVLVVQMVSFNQPDNPWRALYESRNGPDWRPWSQEMNYLANGFMGGFLYNMPVEPMERPAHYSEAALDAIIERYSAEAAAINAARAGGLEDKNVVVVLSESFSDPLEIERFTVGADPIPFTREVMDKTWAGDTLGSVFGGGTANMEFEVLTGQSISLLRPQLHSPFQMLVPDFRAYPSLVGALKNEGHEAVAIHPFNRSMYKRQDVYETFGFDEFVDESTISDTTTIEDNPYIADQAAFDEVLDQIDAANDPLMVSLVTMQNHAPYAELYSDPIEITGGLGPWFASMVGNYTRGLAHTDEALEDFLGALEEQGEDTIVLFYGDHLPGSFPDDVIGRSLGSSAYRTPFFIWDSAHTRPGVPLQPASPGFFLPLLYEYADAPVSPYLALLQRFHEEVGSLQRGQVIDRDGEPLAREDLTAHQRQLLDDLTLVQYDIVMGDWYALEQMWPGATGAG